jgi:hypothetical protein
LLSSRDSSASATSVITFSTEHRHVFADNPQFAAFLAGFPIIPGIKLQATFDQNRPTFCEVFTGDFRSASPQRDIDECRLVLPLSIERIR